MSLHSRLRKTQKLLRAFHKTVSSMIITHMATAPVRKNKVAPIVITTTITTIKIGATTPMKSDMALTNTSMISTALKEASDPIDRIDQDQDLITPVATA